MPKEVADGPGDAAVNRAERRRAFAEALGRAAGRTVKEGELPDVTAHGGQGESSSTENPTSEARAAVRRGSAAPLARHRDRAWETLYASPLYGLLLLGRRPASLTAIPPDPWPGDASRGTAILQGQFRFAGQTLKTSGDPWHPEGASEGWLADVHGFGWLRDLRAVGGDGARRRARELVASWIAAHGRWSHPAWRTETLSARICAWLGQYEFFCASADDAFRTRFFGSLSKQVRHLSRAVPGSLSGADLILAIKGLAYAGLSLPSGEARLAKALGLLEQELPGQILADGGHIERCPSTQLHVLRHLIDIRAAVLAAGEPVPQSIQNAIDRMAPMIRFFRHADGGFALFNGGQEEEAWRIDMLLAQADARGKAPQQAPHSGFQRLQANRTLVLMDVGPPPPQGLDGTAHAGTLSFELSHGKDRIIVNCGAHSGSHPTWRDVLRATAAHSTITVDDTNSCEFLADGGIGRRPVAVPWRREQQDGSVWLEVSHDGYAETARIVHRRKLFLAASGEDLRGEDNLLPIGGTIRAHSFALRFHLHPTVRASLTHDGTAVLLAPASGPGWRVRASGGAVELAESVYLGTGGEVKRTQQIVVAGPIGVEGAVIKWAIRREGRR